MNKILDDILANPEIKKNISETSKAVRFLDIQLDKEIFDLAKTLKNYIQQKKLGSVSISNEFGIDINLESPDYKEDYSVVSTLKIEKSQPFFVTKKGFKNFLSKSNEIKFTRAIIFFSDVCSFSFVTSFCPIENNDINRSIQVSNVSPIKYIKPLNTLSQNFLPVLLQEWSTDSKYFGNACSEWKQESTKKLYSLIGNQFLIEANFLDIDFRGERKKSIKIDLNNSQLFELSFEKINQIIFWIFFENNDIDTKHTLFNQQMSALIEDDRNIYQNDDLLKKFTIAFENTQLSYRYLISNISSNLQKNLNDLNKTLFDYISKIHQNTSDLGQTLWRDFATILGVMILNFAIKKTDILTKYFPAFAIALCIYVCLSFFIISNSGFWYYYSLKKNLNNWRNKLYAYLSNSEFEDFAVTPLKNAFRKYRSIFWIVFSAYAISIFLVLIIADIIPFSELKIFFSNFNIFHHKT